MRQHVLNTGLLEKGNEETLADLPVESRRGSTDSGYHFQGVTDTSGSAARRYMRMFDIVALVVCWLSQWAYLVLQIYARPFGWILQVCTILFGVAGTSVMGFHWHWKKRQYYLAKIALSDLDSLYFAIQEGKRYVNGEDCPNLNRVWWWNALFRSTPSAVVSAMLTVVLLVQIPFAQRGVSALVATCPNFREEVVDMYNNKTLDEYRVDREQFFEQSTGKLQNDPVVCHLVNRTVGRWWYALGRMDDLEASIDLEDKCRYANAFLFDRPGASMGVGDPTKMGAVLAQQAVHDVLWPAIKENPTVFVAINHAMGMNEAGLLRAVEDGEKKRLADCEQQYRLNPHMPVFIYKPSWRLRVVFAFLNVIVTFATQGYEASRGIKAGVWPYAHVFLDMFVVGWGGLAIIVYPAMLAWTKVMNLGREFVAPYLADLGDFLTSRPVEILTEMSNAGVNELEREFKLTSYIFSFHPAMVAFLMMVLAIISAFLVVLAHFNRTPHTYVFPIVVTTPLAGLDGKRPVVKSVMLLAVARILIYSIPAVVAPTTRIGFQALMASILQVKVSYILYHAFLVVLVLATLGTGYMVASASRLDEAEEQANDPELLKIVQILSKENSLGYGAIPTNSSKKGITFMGHQLSMGMTHTATQAMIYQQTDPDQFSGMQSLRIPLEATGYEQPGLDQFGGVRSVPLQGHHRSMAFGPEVSMSMGQASMATGRQISMAQGQASMAMGPQFSMAMAPGPSQFAGQSTLPFPGKGGARVPLASHASSGSGSPPAQGSPNQTPILGAAPSPRMGRELSTPMPIQHQRTHPENLVADPPVAVARPPAPRSPGMCPAPTPPPHGGQQLPNPYVTEYGSAR